MSQDNLVTPQSVQSGAHFDWVARSLSLAAVPLLRRRNIEKFYGAAKGSSGRCGCQHESRYPSPLERAVLWCGVHPLEPVRQVLSSTRCRALPAVWLVLTPNGGRYAWAEIWELQSPGFLSTFEEVNFFSRVMTLEEWEIVGRRDFQLRPVHRFHDSPDLAVSDFRNSMIKEIMNRNTQYSHVNLSLEKRSTQFSPKMLLPNGQNFEFDLEILRDRYVPMWRRCGDMALTNFTTYTITRKDV